jgi:hypothetical protein
MNRSIHFPGRVFQLWAYTVSRRQLLLRSTKSEEHPSRIDVIFWNVLRVNLPVTLRGLEISESSASTNDFLAELPAESRRGQNLYTLKGDITTGSIVASGIDYIEDGGEYDQPSALFTPYGL